MKWRTDVPAKFVPADDPELPITLLACARIGAVHEAWIWYHGLQRRVAARAASTTCRPRWQTVTGAIGVATACGGVIPLKQGSADDAPSTAPSRWS